MTRKVRRPTASVRLPRGATRRRPDNALEHPDYPLVRFSPDDTIYALVGPEPAVGGTDFIVYKFRPRRIWGCEMDLRAWRAMDDVFELRATVVIMRAAGFGNESIFAHVRVRIELIEPAIRSGGMAWSQEEIANCVAEAVLMGDQIPPNMFIAHDGSIAVAEVTRPGPIVITPGS